MMLCYSKTREIKHFLTPPPKKSVSIPAARDHKIIITLLSWNTRYYFGHQKPYMNDNSESIK